MQTFEQYVNIRGYQYVFAKFVGDGVALYYNEELDSKSLHFDNTYPEDFEFNWNPIDGFTITEIFERMDNVKETSN